MMLFIKSYSCYKSLICSPQTLELHLISIHLLKNEGVSALALLAGCIALIFEGACVASVH